MTRLTAWLVAVTALGMASTPCSAAGVQRALIVCGHPGDAAHQALFAESIESIRDSLTSRFGFSRQHVHVQFAQAAIDQSELADTRGTATYEELEDESARLSAVCGPEDALWVIVVGHAHFDGRRAFLNLPGPDVHMEGLAKLFENVSCREQVFLVTTPVSGYIIKSLTRKGRIVISATEDDLETNETRFHQSLATVLNEIKLDEAYDADKDGRLSWLDLYIALTRDVAQLYLDEELIATEHAMLDDNGDGHGSEIQLDYLTEELGGRANTRRARRGIRPGRDGEFAARSILKLTDRDPSR